MLTYAIVDSMNGFARGRRTSTRAMQTAMGEQVGDTVLWVKNLAEITVPGPAERMVFIDQGWAVPDSFVVTLLPMEQWWDRPPVRHGDGTSVSFADGHCEHWRWQGEETILNGRAYEPGRPSSSPIKLATPEDKDDLHRLQKAVWGRLGY